jgi:uncharacterized membrane protein YfcA
VIPANAHLYIIVHQITALYQHWTTGQPAFAAEVVMGAGSALGGGFGPQSRASVLERRVASAGPKALPMADGQTIGKLRLPLPPTI